MKVAVVGSSGQLGRELVLAFTEAGHEALEVEHGRFEIAFEESVRSELSALEPDLVVNAAAMHHVERCEAEPERAFAVNALGARHVARYARDAGIPVCYVSTDYVFDGEKGEPYVESDLPRPINVYGNSKLAGEHFTRAENPRHWIVRVSGLYGRFPCRGKGAHFVAKMLELARTKGAVSVVDDEFVSPTAAEDAARQIATLVALGPFGLFHATSQGGCSWYEFAEEIFRATGTKVRLERARPGQFPAKVPRPRHAVLDNAALRAAGIDGLPTWREGLHRHLALSAESTVR